jgi:hypothetical protein
MMTRAIMMAMLAAKGNTAPTMKQVRACSAGRNQACGTTRGRRRAGRGRLAVPMAGRLKFFLPPLDIFSSLAQLDDLTPLYEDRGMSRRQLYKAPEGVKIRRLAASESLDILFTCDEKLRKHEIWRPDALSALRTGSVVKSERRNGEWRRTIRGIDRDEGEISLVITVDQEHRLIVVLDGWR